jgi:uncharacterized protein (DUF1330 family)
MSVYLIAQINIHNRTTYAKYASGFMEIFTRYSGRILSVDEAPKVIEGEWRYTRTVLLSSHRRTRRSLGTTRVNTKTLLSIDLLPQMETLS